MVKEFIRVYKAMSTEVNMLMIIKMDMEFINGQTELFMKAHSKMT